MKSIVIELQQLASDGTCPIATLLRKALIVAAKLNLEDFKKWIDNELNGYKNMDEIPEYREVIGALKSWNPYNGIWMPVIWPGMPKRVTEHKVGESVSEMEHALAARTETSILTIPFSPDLSAMLMKILDSPTPLTLIISYSQYAGILEKVRNIVLSWSLKLEADGVLGADLTFTEQEKQKVSSTTYNIQNFVGVLGEVKSEKLQIGDYNLIDSELKKYGISESERGELKNILDDLKIAQKDEEKKPLIKRGMDWLKRNAATIGTLAEIIKSWLRAN